MAQSYTVVWLDVDGYATKMHYFEAEDYPDAFRKLKRNRQEVEMLGHFACGFLLQEATVEIHKRFFDGTKVRFYEIELHMYAPEHLRPKS